MQSMNTLSSCFPLWAGFACFITDCSVSFIFLIFTFDAISCFPLFRFFSWWWKSEKTYGSGESGELWRADRGPIKILPYLSLPPRGAFLAELPFKAASAAWCRRTATNEGRPLLRTAFLYPVFAIAKIAKNVQLPRGFPLGGGSLRSKVERGVTYSVLTFFIENFHQEA